MALKRGFLCTGDVEAESAAHGSPQSCLAAKVYTSPADRSGLKTDRLCTPGQRECWAPAGAEHPNGMSGSTVTKTTELSTPFHLQGSSPSPGPAEHQVGKVKLWHNHPPKSLKLL
nr:uncharacterized protein LOC100984122 isoform X2 [Pan paniscus]